METLAGMETREKPLLGLGLCGREEDSAGAVSADFGGARGRERGHAAVARGTAGADTQRQRHGQRARACGGVRGYGGRLRWSSGAGIERRVRAQMRCSVRRWRSGLRRGWLGFGAAVDF
jgi:hypothetical protein